MRFWLGAAIGIVVADVTLIAVHYVALTDVRLHGRVVAGILAGVALFGALAGAHTDPEAKRLRAENRARSREHRERLRAERKRGD